MKAPGAKSAGGEKQEVGDGAEAQKFPGNCGNTPPPTPACHSPIGKGFGGSPSLTVGTQWG